MKGLHTYSNEKKNNAKKRLKCLIEVDANECT